MVIRLKILIKFPFKHQNIPRVYIFRQHNTTQHVIHVSIFSRHVNAKKHIYHNKLKDKFSKC